MIAALLAFLPQVSGDAEIRGKAGASEIVIRTTSRLAGAIHSLAWGGKEFIDSADHGRQLQSASNFDAGSKFTPETFNPTEAGSMSDGAGPKSTSVLLSLKAEKNVLETRSRMAFWLRPGETSGGHPAKNTAALSGHVLAKKVVIRGHAIEYAATFTVPEGEKHTYAQFEAATGYMPAEFSRFLAYDAAKKETEPLSDGPGEQPKPVILSTPSGSHAMGIYTPQRGPGYGRWRFEREKVVKWNCVFRVRDPKGVAAGDYAYRMFVLVGSLDDVVAALRTLHETLPPRAGSD